MSGPDRRHTRRNRVLAGLSVLVLVTGLLWQRCGVHGCPNVDRLTSYQPGGATVLLDTDGAVFADLSPVAHAVVSLDSLPAHVPAAFVAVEDKRFYDHGGIDYRRVAGAAVADLRAGAFVEGFSTITMQLARNVWPDRLPGRDRTPRRKVLEIRVSRDIEDRYTKDEILELYLNHIYFGSGAYGIEAASRNFFGKPAAGLTLAEAALLAALPKSPTLYNPRRFAERARERRDLVLALMAAQDLITTEEQESASAQRLGVRREAAARAGEPGTAPYFVEATRRVLEDRFGENVYTAPLRVHTTLDPSAQRIAEQQLERQLRAIERGRYGAYMGPRYQAGTLPEDGPGYVQGAFVLMEAATGNVLALVGGRDFRQSRFDRATQARRQAGSAFKPFVYAAALAEGYAASQLVSDSVLRLELTGGEVWEPRNEGGEFEGSVTLRDALVRSKNVPTIRLAADVGMGDVARMARRAGIRSELPAVPSLAIGTAGMTPLELTAAYALFARAGTSVAPRLVTRVETADGSLLWEPPIESTEVVDSAVAYVITDMLREAVSRGTGQAVRRAGYSGPAAGKTGTTNDAADAWFAGYTPRYVATVWIGFDRPHAITADASGGRLAAPVWARVLNEYAGDRAEEWPIPSGVVRLSVDPATGLVLRDGCSPERGEAGTELFIRGEEPGRICPAGEPALEDAGLVRRTGSWMGRQWRRFGRWVTRHFGSEDPQQPPQEREYLGMPRLPRAADLESDVDPDTFRVPLGTPVPIDVDSIAIDTLVLPRMDSLIVPPPDTLRADTLAGRRVLTPRDTTARRDTLVRRDTLRQDTLLRDPLPVSGRVGGPVPLDPFERRVAGQTPVSRDGQLRPERRVQFGVSALAERAGHPRGQAVLRRVRAAAVVHSVHEEHAVPVAADLRNRSIVRSTAHRTTS